MVSFEVSLWILDDNDDEIGGATKETRQVKISSFRYQHSQARTFEEAAVMQYLGHREGHDQPC
jgi:hypothetical protein